MSNHVEHREHTDDDSDVLIYVGQHPYPDGELPDPDRARNALRVLAARATPSSLDKVLTRMSDDEVIADVEISFGRLGDPLTSDDFRERLQRLRR